MVGKYIQSNKGFSLVELLITVVIAGVLAAVGVPQYKRMVNKSKSAEAKVLLGAISTGESVLFTEFATYGNDLIHMGVEASGSKYYVAGWAKDATCVQLSGTEYEPDTISGMSAWRDSTAKSTVGKFNSAQALGTVCTKLIEGAANGSVTPTASVFTAAAASTLKDSAPSICDTGGACDVWTINQAGTLTNTIAGYIP